MVSGDMSRRRFLSAACGSIAVAGGMFVGRGIEARAVGRVPANDRIGLGFIGVGGMGRSHLDHMLANPQVHVAAVADVDALRVAAARKRAARAGLDVAGYGDFRELLERPDIDAVFVSTPDHWHAQAAIQAMTSGKDVYCEKPLARTVSEGREIVETARRTGRVCQVGTQQRSDWRFRHACELVVNGRIGDVRRVTCFFDANPTQAPLPDQEAPAHLDWEMWLGNAPWRPFNTCIHPYGFRHFTDFSGGLLADWGVHLLDIAQWGCQKDATSPRKIEAEGRMWQGPNMYEFPRSMHVRYDYGDVAIDWHQGSPDIFEPGQKYGTLFHGSDGDIFVNRSGYKLHPRPGRVIHEDLGPDDTRLRASHGHREDFLDCVRTRSRPICDVAIGHGSTCLPLLGNIAHRLGRPIEFDLVAQVCPNDRVATRMLGDFFGSRA